MNKLIQEAIARYSGVVQAKRVKKLLDINEWTWEEFQKEVNDYWSKQNVTQNSETKI